MRHADYRGYAEGRFFFPTANYAQWMRQAVEIFSDRGRVGIVVASDESPDPAAFAGLPFVFASATGTGKGHYLEDLAEIGMCDVVLATASSFAWWGAFQGARPVIPLTRANQVVRPEDAVQTIWDCVIHPDLRVAIW